MVSPFVVMTIGAWFLGGAYVAWRSARIRSWFNGYPGLLFLGAFGILQLAVLLVSRDDIQVGGQLGGGYLLAIVVVTLVALYWAYDWTTNRGKEPPTGTPTPMVMRVIAAVFATFSGYFGLRLLLGISKGGNIWPGMLSPVTGRSFGAFYAALAVAVIPLIWSRTLAPIIGLLPGAIVGSIVITIPALVYIELFDFEEKPGGFIYIGTYLIVSVVATVILLQSRLRAEDPRRHVPE